jgi:pimeloyl-ACP methyl ester carboxylesterase
MARTGHALTANVLGIRPSGELLTWRAAGRHADDPTAPPLPWAPDIPVRYVTVDGTRIRYLVTGSGPALVLLHTLRTQLDMFQKVVPELATRFRVYALDYPGHGHSDAPDADYAAELFVESVAGFLDRLKIQDTLLAGESIGGTIGRVQPYAAVKRILQGGVYRRDAFPPALLRELHAAGTAPGHARAFAQLVRHWPSWEQARAEYGSIAVPVLLLYGDHDWSRDAERETDHRAIPGSRMRVVKDAGHFLALDAPGAFVQAVVDSHASFTRPSQT